VGVKLCLMAHYGFIPGIPGLRAITADAGVA